MTKCTPVTGIVVSVNRHELGQMSLSIGVPGKPAHIEIIAEVDNVKSYVLLSTPGEQRETSLHAALEWIEDALAQKR